MIPIVDSRTFLLTRPLNPFKEADDLLKAALEDLKSGKDTDALKKLKAYKAEYDSVITGGKFTPLQKTTATLNLPRGNSEINKILEKQATIIAILFGTEGLRNKDFADLINKALSELEIDDNVKTNVFNQAFVIAQVNEILNNIPGIREIEIFTEEHGALAERLGLSEGSQPVKYDGLTISEKAAELSTKITQQPIELNLAGAGKIAVISTAATELSHPPAQPPTAAAAPAPPPPPTPTAAPPPSPPPVPPQDIVSLFLAETKSFKPTAPTKGSEIAKLIKNDIAQKNHGLKFIQTLAKKGVISSDEEYAALLQVAGDHSIAEKVSKSNFDDEKFPNVFGVTFTDGYSSIRPANRLYQFITQYLNSESERNFLAWSTNNYLQTTHKIAEAPAFNGSTRKVNSDDAKAKTEAEKDLQFISKLLDHASTNGILGADTIQLLNAILSDPASVNVNANPNAYSEEFNKELSKLVKLIDRIYGSLINKVRNHVLDPNEQKGGKFSPLVEETSNLALALTIPPDDMQRFLFKGKIITTLKTLPLEQGASLVTKKRDKQKKDPISQGLKTFSIKDQSELEKIFTNPDSKERILLKAYFKIVNEEGLPSIEIIKKRFPNWGDFDNILGSINSDLNKNGLQSLVFFLNSEDPASKAYSVLVQKGIPPGDTISSFEQLCTEAKTTSDKRDFAAEIVCSPQLELICILNPGFIPLMNLASNYYDETDPAKKPTAEPAPPAATPPAPVPPPPPPPPVPLPPPSPPPTTISSCPLVEDLAQVLGIQNGTLPTLGELHEAFGSLGRTQKLSLTDKMLLLGKEIEVTLSDGKTVSIPPKEYDFYILSSRTQ